MTLASSSMFIFDIDPDHTVLLAIALWVIVLMASVKLASSRGKSQIFWLFLVASFPPALVVLLLMPKLKRGGDDQPTFAAPENSEEFLRRCGACGNLTDASLTHCRVCGR
ncbi:MAG: hypothetical protein ABJN40_15575 [Sneathiella sp.]